MNAYYALKATLRYYMAGTKKTWPDPPHVFFANLELTPESLRKFEKTYGPMRTWETKQRVANEERVVSSDPMTDAQERQWILRMAWCGDTEALLSMGIGNTVGYVPDVEPARGPIRIVPGVTKDGIDLYALGMWSFIRIAFLHDFFEGKIGLCANSEHGCPAPYFLIPRKGQEYCTHKCAVQMNVRRFREREKLRSKHSGRKNSKPKREK